MYQTSLPRRNNFKNAIIRQMNQKLSHLHHEFTKSGWLVHNVVSLVRIGSQTQSNMSLLNKQTETNNHKAYIVTFNYNYLFSIADSADDFFKNSMLTFVYISKIRRVQTSDFEDLQRATIFQKNTTVWCTIQAI